MLSVKPKNQGRGIKTSDTAPRAPAPVSSQPAASASRAHAGFYAAGPLLSLSPLQAKFTIGKANDPYEQEADAVAESVVNGRPAPAITPVPAAGLASAGRLPGQAQTAKENHEEAALQAKWGNETPSLNVQRQPEPEEEEEEAEPEEETIQSKLLQRQVEQEDEEPIRSKLLQRQPEEENEESLQTQSIQRQPEPEEEEEEAEPEAETVQSKLLQRQVEEEEEEPIQRKLLQRQAEEEKEESLQTQSIQCQPEPEEEEEEEPEKEEEEEPIQTKLLQRQVEEEEEEFLQTQLIQRQPEAEEEEEATPVQRKPRDQKPVVSTSLSQQLQALRGNGQALPATERGFFESGFGADFSDVRIHTDAGAAHMARSINARAFTQGYDVVFGDGQYAPGTQAGRHLLAHELTHVVQQNHSSMSLVPASTSTVVQQQNNTERTEEKLFQPPSLQAPVTDYQNSTQLTMLQRFCAECKGESHGTQTTLLQTRRKLNGADTSKELKSDTDTEPADELLDEQEVTQPLLLQREFSPPKQEPPPRTQLVQSQLEHIPEGVEGSNRAQQAIPVEAPYSGNKGETASGNSSTVQPKLTIGTPNDEYEKEADTVAEKVMRMPLPAATSAIEEDRNLPEQNAVIQSKYTENSPHPSVHVEQVIQSPSGGNPPPAYVRSRVGQLLGTRLDHVRVHSDVYANSAAKAINAKAFTHKNHIYLGYGQSSEDVPLMAHELTHVVQQRTTSRLIQRNPDDEVALGGDPTLTFTRGARLSEVSNEVAGAIAAEANALERAIHAEDDEAVLQVLRRNAGPQMHLLREAYGEDFFYDINRVFTTSRHIILFDVAERWGEARALLGDTLSLSEELWTLSGVLSTNRAAVFDVIKQLSDDEALSIVETHGITLPEHNVLSFRTFQSRTNYERTSRTLARLLGSDSDDYYRAMRIILRKAESARAARGGESIIGLPIGGENAIGEEGMGILDPIHQARVDLMWNRILQTDQGWGFLAPFEADASRAFLSLTDLDAEGRQAIAARIREHSFEHMDDATRDRLLQIADEPDDATAIAAAMREALNLNRHDSLGMEIASERAGAVISQARARGLLGGMEESEALSDLLPARTGIGEQAVPAEQVEQILHDPELLEELVQRSAELFGVENRYLVWLGNMHVSESTIGIFRLRHASNFHELFEAVQAIPPQDRFSAVNSREGQEVLRLLHVTPAQQESITALVIQGLPAYEFFDFELETDINAEDMGPDADTTIAAQQILFAVQDEHPEQAFGILSRLTDAQRVQVGRTEAFHTLERELSDSGVENMVLLGNLRDALENDVLAIMARRTYVPVLRDNMIRSEVRNFDMYEQTLAAESRGERDQRRRGFVLWHRLQQHPDLEISPEERRLVAEYELDRELISSANQEQRRRLNDAMLGAPLVFDTEGELDPNMEADYLYFRLIDRAGAREGLVAPWNWEPHDYDEAVTTFMLRYRDLRRGGVNPSELADLVLLYDDAMQTVDAYIDANDRFARDMASMAGCVAGVVVLSVLSNGTLTPVAVGALAAFAGGTAAATTGYLIRAESHPEDILTDFSVGAVEGALVVVGQELASRIVSRMALASRGTASAAVRTATGNAVRHTAASTSARLAESVIDGMIGGAGGELFLTVTNESIWDQEISRIIATLLSAIARGATMGALGGAVGFGVGEVLGRAWRRLRLQHGSSNADDILHAFERAEIDLSSISRMDESAQQALFRARALHAAGRNRQAARVLSEVAGLEPHAAQRVLNALRQRSLLIRRAAQQMDRVVDDVAADGLTRELGIQVRANQPLEGRQVLIDYRLGTWGDPTAISIRVSGEATVGDVLLHSIAIRRIQQFQRQARTFRGFFERVTAWLRGQGRALPRSQELLAEMEKHGLMMEARQLALRSLPLNDATRELLEADIRDIGNWIRHFQDELAVRGAPEGVIGSRLRGATPESRSARMQTELANVEHSQRQMVEATEQIESLNRRLSNIDRRIRDIREGGSGEGIDELVADRRMLRREIRQARVQRGSARQSIMDAEREANILIQDAQADLRALQMQHNALLAPYRHVYPPTAGNEALYDQLRALERQIGEIRYEINTLRQQRRGLSPTLQGRAAVHEQVVTTNLRANRRYLNVGVQVRLEVTLSNGRTIRIRPDNLVQTGRNRFLIVDAKWTDDASLHIGQRPSMTPNQSLAYPEISSGRITSARFVDDAGAQQFGRVPGTPITLESRVQIHTNTAEGNVISYNFR